MKIKAFGKYINRKKAEQIIINDFIGNILYAGETSGLVYTLMRGWKGLICWSDLDLEDYIENEIGDEDLNGLMDMKEVL